MTVHKLSLRRQWQPFWQLWSCRHTRGHGTLGPDRVNRTATNWKIMTKLGHRRPHQLKKGFNLHFSFIILGGTSSLRKFRIHLRFFVVVEVMSGRARLTHAQINYQICARFLFIAKHLVEIWLGPSRPWLTNRNQPGTTDRPVAVIYMHDRRRRAKGSFFSKLCATITITICQKGNEKLTTRRTTKKKWTGVWGARCRRDKRFLTAQTTKMTFMARAVIMVTHAHPSHISPRWTILHS